MRRRVAEALSRLLYTFQRSIILGQHRMRATDQALIALVLSRDQRLIRCVAGTWNHRAYQRGLPDPNKGGQGSFVSGFTDRTIQRLIEAGRASPAVFDEDGRVIAVEWIPI